MADQPQWSSVFSGYLDRAAPHPKPAKYKFERSSLTLLARLSALGHSDGFSLALFSDRTAVDACGRLFLLQREDYDGLVNLAASVHKLSGSSTDALPTYWSIAHNSTCWPNDILYTPRTADVQSPSDFVRTNVYGFHKGTRSLNQPVGEYTELPTCLWELIGLVREARPREVLGTTDSDPKTVQAVKKFFKES